MLSTVYGAIAGFANYLKGFHTSSPMREGTTAIDDFETIENRLGRYRLWWAMYENTAYSDHHAWSRSFKSKNRLGPNVRGTYNPFGRIGDFWSTHIWVGDLNPATENGRVADSAVPILTANEAIREPIGKLWRDSGFATNKDIFPRLGSVLGDFAGRVEDDRKAGKVRIIPVNPSTIHWASRDAQGNVDAYVICERRWDPRFDPRSDSYAMHNTVSYTEKAYRDGDTVYFETYLGEDIYPWNGVSGRWEEKYGFVPLVIGPHIKPLPEAEWGWAECHKGFTKGLECDSMGSYLHEQIRKASDPKWWAAGARPPAAGASRAAPTQADPDPAASELPIVYADMGSAISPMVFPLDIQFTSMEIMQQIGNLEKDYPEIRYESARASGDASAKALREVRKACEAKVHNRRLSYDDALVRLQKMALSIGGMQGYPGYEAFNAGSYKAGQLDHTIGPRTVFLLDPLDRAEEEAAQWTNWQTAKLAGVPAEFFMTVSGFSEELKALFRKAIADEQQQAVDLQIQVATATAKAQAAARPAPSGAAP